MWFVAVLLLDMNGLARLAVDDGNITGCISFAEYISSPNYATTLTNSYNFKLIYVSLVE